VIDNAIGHLLGQQAGVAPYDGGHRNLDVGEYLNLRSAAIDEQLDAGDKAGVIGGEKQRRLGDFVPLESWTRSAR
jgi:hypothetical protein